MVLPAGQTSLLQPLDVSVFGGLKKCYNDYVRSQAITANPVCHRIFFLDELSHLGDIAFDCVFHIFRSPEILFRPIWPKSAGVLASGFRKTGLFPFDPSVIEDTVRRKHEVEKPVVTPIQAAGLLEIENILHEKMGVSPRRALALRMSLSEALDGKTRD